MKVLVLGAEGMLGHITSYYLEEQGYEVTKLDRAFPFTHSGEKIDVTNLSKLKTFLDSHTFDVVINTISLLAKPSAENKELASFLNGYFPHFLESFYRNTNCRIINISTDAVFSGDKPPYFETSPYSNQTFYGRSKGLGEIINDKDLTFRLSIIGPELNPNGISLLNWFFSQKGNISGFSRVNWIGVTTLLVAQAIDQAIKQKLTGLYHLVSPTAISKYELLKLCNEIFKRGLTVSPNESSIDNKILINTRTDFNFEIPYYEVMLKDLKSWMLGHPNLYQLN